MTHFFTRSVAKRCENRSNVDSGPSACTGVYVLRAPDHPFSETDYFPLERHIMVASRTTALRTGGFNRYLIPGVHHPSSPGATGTESLINWCLLPHPPSSGAARTVFFQPSTINRRSGRGSELAVCEGGHSGKKKAIIGGCIGGVFLLVFIILLWPLRRRGRQIGACDTRLLLHQKLTT